jgi:UrcA family protein
MNTLNTSRNLRGLIATALVAALSVGLVGVSTAADFEARSMTVKYGDLNLSDPQGAATLYRRISWAAREVCSSPDDTLSTHLYFQACVDKAIADAVTQVGHPQLIAVYNAKNRQPLPIRLATR